MNVVLIPTAPALAARGVPAWTALLEGFCAVSGVGPTALAAIVTLQEAVGDYDAMAARHGWEPLNQSSVIQRVTTLPADAPDAQVQTPLTPQALPGMASSVTCSERTM